MKTRTFLIKDIDATVDVEFTTRKEMFGYMDEYMENLEYSWFNPSDDSFAILYKDGSWDFVDDGYDGHKVKKTNIASIVYTNACTYMVYGNFEMNEYGCVTCAMHETTISDTNIEEIA